MSYKNRNLIKTSQNLPRHLKHKPIYAIPYAQFDGIYAGKTDALYLSIGKAQYDPESISLKVLRHTGKQWSPQSEEFPVHRVIDLTILAAKALFDVEPHSDSIELSPGALFDQNKTISIPSEREHRLPEDMKSFENFKKEHESLIRARLNALADVLNDMRMRGRL